MNINRAVTILAKKFQLNSETFKACTKQTVIRWATNVADAMALEKKTGQDNLYRLTRHQHAFLTGDFNYLPMAAGNRFEF